MARLYVPTMEEAFGPTPAPSDMDPWPWRPGHPQEHEWERGMINVFIARNRLHRDHVIAGKFSYLKPGHFHWQWWFYTGWFEGFSGEERGTLAGLTPESWPDGWEYVLARDLVPAVPLEADG